MLLPPLGFPATGPPFGIYPDVPAALIVTEGFRLCSPGPDVELVGVFPLSVVLVVTDGTAGGITILPLMDGTSDLSCCEALDVVSEAEGGENVFLVALA